MDLEGHRLGKYLIERRIGAGNMATVYLARDPFIDRPVALKVAHAGDTRISETVELAHRFLAEAQTAGALRHPNITTVFDAGVADGQHYIVMEYVPGGATLDQYTAIDHLLPLDQCTNVLCQCALALDYAHRKGVIHRDIKPRNLLLTPDGIVKVTDFGVAVTYAGTAHQPDERAGSPLYMSPEQFRDEPLNAQTDLFSLGIVAYELLTGHHPFAAGNLEAIRHRTLTARPPELRALRADIPEVYQRIIDKALAKSPYHRYRSGGDMAGDISLVHDFLRASARGMTQQEKLTRAQRLTFFGSFLELELWEIVHAAEWLELGAGQTMAQDTGHEPLFFVIVEGTALVSRGGSSLVELRTGDCLGATGSGAREHEPAALVAVIPVTIMKLRSTVIDRMPVNCQLRFQRAFTQAMIERLERAPRPGTSREAS